MATEKLKINYMGQK